MQALEFPINSPAGQFEDGGERVGVVRRELRIEGGAGVKHSPGAGKIGDIGRDLAREHRIGFEAALLRPLDLAVPIGALDQPQHQPAPRPGGQFTEPIDDRERPRLIGLEREPEPVPAGEIGGQRQRLDQVERQFEAVRFLGIDRKADAEGAGITGESEQRRQKFAPDPAVLGHFIARVQCRQFDRDPGRRFDRPAGSCLADRGDRAAIGAVVALGILHRARRLAEHVEGMAIAVALGAARPPQGFLDRAPHDELVGENAHRGGDRLAPYRLTRARDEAAQNAAEIGVTPRTFGAQQSSGQHQRPGRGIDEERAGMAEMALPIGRGDLVADQPVDGLGIGDPQQRLGDTHQRDALGRGQRVFLQKGVEPAPAEALAADRHDQPARGRGDPVARIRGDLGGGEDACIGLGLVEAMRVADRRPQRRLRRRRAREHQLHCGILSRRTISRPDRSPACLAIVPQFRVECAPCVLRDGRFAASLG